MIYRKLPDELLDDLNWKYPKPFSAIYTYPDEENSPALPYCTFQIKDCTPRKIDVEVMIDGYNLNGAPVFDHRWTFQSRKLQEVINLTNSFKNRTTLRKNIVKLKDSLHLNMEINNRCSMKTLKTMYAQCLIARGAEQADLLGNLLPDYDVVCLFVLIQGYPLLSISVVPYESPIELISTDESLELKHNVRRGYISEILKNGFLSFKDLECPSNPIRVHKTQLQPGKSGDCFLVRNPSQAFDHSLRLQTNSIASHCMGGLGFGDTGDNYRTPSINVLEVATFSPNSISLGSTQSENINIQRPFLNWNFV